ncbi:MAG: hypothetical protein OXR68_02445 [Alphaproteobacteria bacterium]|nr:hypothetical protein [Alphaproteobacteria bacterium]
MPAEGAIIFKASEDPLKKYSSLLYKDAEGKIINAFVTPQDVNTTPSEALKNFVEGQEPKELPDGTRIEASGGVQGDLERKV